MKSGNSGKIVLNWSEQGSDGFQAVEVKLTAVEAVTP